MKTLTVRQMAAVKRVAQNVNYAVTKKNKVAAKIYELNTEYNTLVDEIEGHEAGIKAITGGLTSEDLLVKKVIDTGKVDKDGRPIKATKYEPKEGVVIYNEETKVYEIHTAEDVAPVDELPIDSVDDTEPAHEVEVKAGEKAPIDLLGFNGEEAGE